MIRNARAVAVAASVTLTAVHFQTLQRGNSVSVTSSNNGPMGIGHDHRIALACP